eukprot:8475159-Alexandrium_andersonii.AAC.1
MKRPSCKYMYDYDADIERAFRMPADHDAQQSPEYAARLYAKPGAEPTDCAWAVWGDGTRN